MDDDGEYDEEEEEDNGEEDEEEFIINQSKQLNVASETQSQRGGWFGWLRGWKRGDEKASSGGEQISLKGNWMMSNLDGCWGGYFEHTRRK